MRVGSFTSTTMAQVQHTFISPCSIAAATDLDGGRCSSRPRHRRSGTNHCRFRHSLHQVGLGAKNQIVENPPWCIGSFISSVPIRLPFQQLRKCRPLTDHGSFQFWPQTLAVDQYQRTSVLRQLQLCGFAEFACCHVNTHPASLQACNDSSKIGRGDRFLLALRLTEDDERSTA
jgi:hypothetical protein